MTAQNKKHFDEIMKRPLQQLRGALFAAFKGGRFNQNQMDAFWGTAQIGDPNPGQRDQIVQASGQLKQQQGTRK